MTETISKQAAFFAIALSRQFDGGFAQNGDQQLFAKTMDEVDIVRAMIEMGVVAERIFVKLPEEARDDLGSDFTTFLMDKFDFTMVPVPVLSESEDAVASWFLEEFELDLSITTMGI